MASTNDIKYLENEIESLKRQYPKAAIEFINLLMKAVKARLVYPANSQLPTQFREEFCRRGKELVEEASGLAFKITSSTLSYEDNVIYESSNRSENFAHVFFRDGVIGLRFLPEIEIDELGRFVDLLSKMMRTIYVDNDMATLLWEENFGHIEYDLIDEGLEIETFEYSTDKFKPSILLGTKDIEEYFLNEGSLTFPDSEEPGSEAKASPFRGPSYSRMSQKTHQFLNRISEFSPEEKSELTELLAADAGTNYTEYLLMMIFEILGMEKELAGYTEVLGFIGRVLDGFIACGNLSGASALLERLQEMSGVLKSMKNPRAEKIDAFLFECASKERIGLLTKALNEQKEIDLGSLQMYMSKLPWAAIDPLITALGELNEYKARQVICRVLVDLAKDHIELLARGLDDEKWYVVRNIVWIMGQIGEPKIINYLKRTIRHPDYRVRYETLNAAARVKAEEAADFMILALSDPDYKIQSLSLKYMLEHSYKRAFPAIENAIKDKNFKNRPPELIREFLEAYAALGQTRALPYLKSLLTKKIFGTSSDERLRHYAALALGHINNQDALLLLKKLTSSKDNRLANMALKALSKEKGDLK